MTKKLTIDIGDTLNSLDLIIEKLERIVELKQQLQSLESAGDIKAFTWYTDDTSSYTITTSY